METEVMVGSELETVTDSSVKLPSEYPSFGVTRTIHVSPTSKSEAETVEAVRAVNTESSYQA